MAPLRHFSQETLHYVPACGSCGTAESAAEEAAREHPFFEVVHPGMMPDVMLLPALFVEDVDGDGVDDFD